MVVLLSDHGEALELPGDRITQKEFFYKKNTSVPIFYPSKENHEAIDRSAGHGTDVLGLSQYHTLLAFREYGGNKNQSKLVKGVVTLLSIKPTLLEWLHLKDNPQTAPSLLSILNNKNNVFQSEPIFLESDFSPDAILSVYPDVQAALLEGIKIFEVDPQSLRLTVKEEMLQKIIDSKQYAIISGDWMLALYPQANHQHVSILINLNTMCWTNDLNSRFAKLSPGAKMLKELRHFYHI